MKSLKREELWIILGVPILFLVGCLFHFLYDITGKLAVVGAIVPVNESVWEHEKLMVAPIIIWWIFYYLVHQEKHLLDRRKWMTGVVAALVSSTALMPMVYYFYTQAFGIEAVVIDIIILLICLAFGQLLGLHIYKYSNGMPVWLSIVIIAFIIMGVVVATFYTPHIAIFRDRISGQYGIL